MLVRVSGYKRPGQKILPIDLPVSEGTCVVKYQVYEYTYITSPFSPSKINMYIHTNKQHCTHDPIHTGAHYSRPFHTNPMPSRRWIFFCDSLR